MKHVQQQNSWSCAACCAAMITGETLEDVVEFIGHDGSEIVEESNHPQKRRSFSMHDILGYLWTKDFWLGAIWAWESLLGDDLSAEMVTDGESHLGWQFKEPALVMVKSQVLPPPCKHVVYWDGKHIWDPHIPEPQSLSEYVILEWWPVVKFEAGIYGEKI